MRDIYHFRSHQLYKQIEDSVSCIVRLLERHEYSIKALYIAQLFILKELVLYDSKIKYSKKKISELRKTASLKAKESKDELGELKNEIKNEISELYKEASNIEIAKEIYQVGTFLHRYIADGIAWRALGYHRSLIRALGAKEPTPAIPDIDQIEQIRWILRGVRKLGHTWLPLLHDLTNCLRTADLSIFRDHQLIQIAELKIRKRMNPGEKWDPEGTPRNSRERRQEIRREQIMQFMKTKNLEDLYPDAKGGKSIKSDTLERHNYEYVSQAISDARKRGCGFISPESGLLYIASKDLEHNSPNLVSEAKREYPHIFASTIAFRSISVRYADYHQTLPITAMQLPAEDILDIMFGRIGVLTVVNLQEFSTHCHELGLPLYIESINKGYHLSVKKNGFQMVVDEGIWDRVLLEALSIESFILLAKDVMRYYRRRYWVNSLINRIRIILVNCRRSLSTK